MLRRAVPTLSFVTVALTLGGCFNHITGSPPTPPWYRLTKEGRDEQERRANPRDKTPHEAWNDARVAALGRKIECDHLAATHPHAEDRAGLFAGCDAEKRAAFRAADEEFRRIDPAGWRAEVAGTPTLAKELDGP